MMQYVHIDKKWLTLVTNGNGFYLLFAKEHQYRNVQHKNISLRLCFCQQLHILASFHQQARSLTARLASGHLSKNALLLATARIVQKGQWNGIRRQQTKNRYIACLLIMSYLQLTRSSLQDGNARLSSINRTMRLPTCFWTTPSSWCLVRASNC